MTALSVAAIIAIIIIGVLVIAELIAISVLLSRATKLMQQVRDRLDPVVGESTQVLHKVNDIAETVKKDTRKVADSVTGVTEHVATLVDTVSNRVDRTTETVQSVTAQASKQLTSPPVLTALALFAGLQLGSSARRAPRWLAAVAVLASIPAGLRAWRSFQQARVATAPATGRRARLVLRRQREEAEAGEAEKFRAA